MARPPSPTVAARNHEIYSLWQRGSSLAELAEQFKLSPQRIGQVVAGFHPEDEEDTDRSLYRGYLWRLFEEVRDLYREPGYKMSPTGRPAEGPDGEAAEDTNVKIQAAELELKIIESLRKLDARDKQQKKPADHETAERQMWEALALERQNRDLTAADRKELEAFRQQRASAVPGEVVRELPAGER